MREPSHDRIANLVVLSQLTKELNASGWELAKEVLGGME
jgi:hypothetical protein